MTVRESPGQRFARREFLRRGALTVGAVTALPALVAACGDGAEPEAGGGSGGGGGATSFAGTINYFSWQGYDLAPGIAYMEDWVAANGVTISPTYAGNHNDITAKFTTGGGTGLFNLSTYMAGYGPFYVDLGIPGPIDTSRIPNFASTYDIFRTGDIASKWFVIDGAQRAIPFTWGLQGINYDSASIDAPGSYLDLLKPEFDGKVGIVDDVVAAHVIGAHVKGIFREDSLYTPAEHEEILSFWKDLKRNARTVIASFGEMADLFVAGEIVAGAPGWAAVNSFAAGKGMQTVQHTVPTEGSATFCDAYMIPEGAEGVDPVYGFIDAALSPEAQAQEAAYLVQACVNPLALDLMDDATRALYPYDQIDQVLSQSAPLEAIPVEVPDGYVSFDDWNTAWEAFKAS